MDFSVDNLTDHQKGHLEFIMMSPSYSDIFKPYLVLRKETLTKLLLRPDTARKDTFNDDYLRGAIHTIDNLLEFFENLVNESSIDRTQSVVMNRDYNPNQEF